MVAAGVVAALAGRVNRPYRKHTCPKGLDLLRAKIIEAEKVGTSLQSRIIFRPLFLNKTLKSYFRA